MTRVWPYYWPKGGMPEKTEPFNWIIKKRLAASWWPDHVLFQRFQKEGISVIINCSEFDNRKDIPQRFKYYHINIPDYGLPTESQIEQFINITKKCNHLKKAIVIHCVAGCGRTGQFIIVWAAYHKFLPKDIDPVKWLRKIRPCCLETEEQMNFARKMAKKYQM